MSQNEIKKCLIPRLRVFFSADLVGSTALKQKARFPLDNLEILWDSHGSLSEWNTVVSDFFSEFSEEAKKYWSASHKEGLIKNRIPEIWKTNGDEIIFTKEIEDRIELHNLIIDWVKIIKKYNEDYFTKPERRLFVKSTVWLAGFPITNNEIVFFKNLEPEEFKGDNSIKPLYYLHKWYEDEIFRKDTQLDFIGPQIDTGFRLCSFANPHKIMISIEAAYFLTNYNNCNTEVIKINYQGLEFMKGVMGGEGYPVFYLDISDFDNLKKKEVILKPALYSISHEKIREFIKEYYERHKKNLIIPFFHKEVIKNQIHENDMPEFCKSAIAFLDKKLEQAFKQLDLEKMEASKNDNNLNFTETEYKAIMTEIDKFLFNNKPKVTKD